MNFDQFKLSILIEKNDVYDVRVHVDGWNKSDSVETSDHRVLSPLATVVDEWMTTGVTLDERAVIGLAVKLAEEALASFIAQHAGMVERTKIAAEKHEARVAAEKVAANAEAMKKNSHLI